MGDDLELTLAALFKPGEGALPQIIQATPPPVIQKAGGPPLPGAPPGADQRTAADHYDNALKALRSGDWSQFGTEMQKLGETLQNRRGGQ